MMSAVILFFFMELQTGIAYYEEMLIMFWSFDRLALSS